ncbi:lysophospholipid acyltransferase family protein [Candidatus Thiothrix sp. Deng01]|uniref:Lysophospholipid acyltransferase family protein n=1 Tax=Candidatus Thiothrix phosphatis TaxID=3112415 RepID=A0ABU6CVY5_9GAMM|nr:lysophospholipid acyltransferase family protein [Candidatus Thiothrix sp. Deng01]MEB4590996.1 lysophospholipid acyltransferase family protein [Candidatus Thiothrix sp. Deng01]
MRWRPEEFSVRYNLLFPLYAHLPPGLGYRLAGHQAGFFRQKRAEEEACIRDQMLGAFPSASGQQLGAWLDDYYRMVEQEALDAWYLQRQPIGAIVELQGFAAVEQARRQGRRVLLTGGHFGRYWMAGPAMRALGHTTGTITRDGGDENIHGLHPAEYRYRLFKLQCLRQALGGPFLVEGDDLRPLYKALNNHLIALIFDVPYVEAHKGVVTVKFISGTIDLPAGIYRIAKKTKAVIAPFFMRDLGNGRVRAEFSALLDPFDYDETALMGLLAGQLEQRIRESPGHWWLWPALPLLRSSNNNEPGRKNFASGREPLAQPDY